MSRKKLTPYGIISIALFIIPTILLIIGFIHSRSDNVDYNLLDTLFSTSDILFSVSFIMALFETTIKQSNDISRKRRILVDFLFIISLSLIMTFLFSALKWIDFAIQYEMIDDSFAAPAETLEESIERLEVLSDCNSKQYTAKTISKLCVLFSCLTINLIRILGSSKNEGENTAE